MNALSKPVRAPFEGPLMTITRLVANVHGVSLTDIRGRKVGGRHSVPRLMAYYLAATLTGKSYPEIGRFFDRDQSTIQSGRRSFERRMKDDPALRELVAEMKVHPDLIGLDQLTHCDAAAQEDLRFRQRVSSLVDSARRTLDRLDEIDRRRAQSSTVCPCCPHCASAHNIPAAP